MTKSISSGVGSSTLQRRIDRMLARDSWLAWIALFLLWVTVGYVYYATYQLVTDSSVRIAMSIGAILVLVFNSASIVAMIRHYKEDKEHIYGLDIRRLDENRARKASRKGTSGETVVRI
jgi:hypothetical protein